MDTTRSPTILAKRHNQPAQPATTTREITTGNRKQKAKRKT